MGVDEQREKEADEAVAKTFSRQMKAATSPYGMFTDPAIAAAATAVLLITMLAVYSSDKESAFVAVLELAVLVPAFVAVVVTLGLGGARKRVVAWLAGLPFPLENMNAVLNGVGDEVEIVFVETLPDAAEVNRRLDEVSADCFVTETEADERSMSVRIGVVDSKRNPARSHYLRFQRLQRLIEHVLVPVHQDVGRIASARIK